MKKQIGGKMKSKEEQEGVARGSGAARPRSLLAMGKNGIFAKQHTAFQMLGSP